MSKQKLSAAAVEARATLAEFLRNKLSPDDLRRASRLTAAYVAAVASTRPRQSSMAEMIDVFFNGRAAK